MSKALPRIEAVFKKLIPSVPFDYQFVDEDYASKFAAEERIGKLAGFFTILAVFISCLGLFGLASFVAEQRTKEVGIRKVLGASTFSLWRLLSKEFVVLGYHFFTHCSSRCLLFYAWLVTGLPVSCSIIMVDFCLAGAGALLITLLTVSFQAIKAAIANPVKSLRTE